MGSEIGLAVPRGAVDRRRAVRYALGAVAGVAAMPVLAACGSAKTTANTSSSTATAASSSVSRPAPLPANTQPSWPLNVAVSQVQVPGSMYATQGSGSGLKLELSAFGNDMWNNDSNFAFYGNQTSAADFTVTCQVAVQSATNSWAKAGIVWMQTLSTGAAFVDLVTTPQHGVNVQYRLVKDQACPGSNGPTIDAVASSPIYLKMQKSGNQLICADSTDGSTWANVTKLTLVPIVQQSAASTSSSSSSSSASGSKTSASSASKAAPAGNVNSVGNAWVTGVNAATTAPLLTPPYYIGIAACAHDATLRGLDGFQNITGLTNPTYTSIFNKAATTEW
jgi:hypothetical protein